MESGRAPLDALRRESLRRCRGSNDERAIESLGVLFMEGEGEPAELNGITATLASSAESAEHVGAWLANAMEGAWAAAEQLMRYPELADLLGVRHRIIANDWKAAGLSLLGARHLRRALAVLERVDFTPAALRADLAGERHAPRYLFSAAELIDRAVDFCAELDVVARQRAQLAGLPRAREPNYEPQQLVGCIVVKMFPHPLSEPLVELIAQRFRVIGEPMRIRILDRLRDGPATVGALTDGLGTSQQNVSKHLGVLQHAGIVSREKRGNHAVYSIADETVFDLCEQVCGSLRRRIAELDGFLGEAA